MDETIQQSITDNPELIDNPEPQQPEEQEAQIQEPESELRNNLIFRQELFDYFHKLHVKYNIKLFEINIEGNEVVIAFEL